MLIKKGDCVVVIEQADVMMAEFGTRGYEFGDVFEVKETEARSVRSSKPGTNWIQYKNLMIWDESNPVDLDELKRLSEAKRAEAKALKEKKEKEEQEALAKLEGNYTETIKEMKYRLKHEIGGSYPGVCSFAYKQLGKMPVYVVGGPCHAALGASHITACILHVHNHLEGIVKENKEFKRENSFLDYCVWLDYILNRSPWSIAFVTKSVLDALYDGIEMNVNVQHDVFVHSAIATRIASEYPQTSRVFCEALENGASEPQAALLSCFISSEGKYWDNGGGHHIISSANQLKDAIEFFKTGFDEKNLNRKKLACDFRDSGYQVTKNIGSVAKPKGRIYDFMRDLLTTIGEGWEARTSFPTMAELVPILKKEWK